MVHLERAILLLLLVKSSILVESFQEVPPTTRRRFGTSSRPTTARSPTYKRKHNNIVGSSWHRGVASASQDLSNSENSPENLGNAINSMTTSARDSIASVVRDEPDYDEEQISQKQQQVLERTKTYTVTLPLTSAAALGSSKSQVLAIGATLGQINKGRERRAMVLDMDSLELTEETSTDGATADGNLESMDEQSLLRRIDGEFQGLVVSSLTPNGAAWAAGVRPGDILKSASATVGSQRWPKSSLEGMRSAIQSRKAMSGSIQLELQRLGEIVDNQFELTLTKPIGLELRGT